MRKMKNLLLAILVVGLVVGVAGASWGVPKMINVQGRLMEGDSPVAEETSVAFEIYTRLTGGSALWSSRPFDVTPDSNGVFNVLVNGSAANTFEGEFPEFLSDTYYLRVIMMPAPGTEIPLSPRQRLVAVPMAITARNLSGGIVKATTEEGDAVKGSFGAFGFSLGAPVQSVGILGKSDGTAVWGQSTRDGEVAIKGENKYTTLGIGASYDTYYGTGVEGLGDIGVHGAGDTVGGSFEGETAVIGRKTGRASQWGLLGGHRISNIIPGIAIANVGTAGAYGQIDTNNYGYLGYEGRLGGMLGFFGDIRKAGVYGYSYTDKGVWGESQSGTGVNAKSSGTATSAIYCENLGPNAASDADTGGRASNSNDDGYALHIGTGKIKIDTRDIVTPGYPGQPLGVRINRAAGRVRLNATKTRVCVYNRYVRSDSMVFVTISGDAYPSGRPADGIPAGIHPYVMNQTDGRFWIWLSRNPSGTQEFEVSFLVINPN